MADTTGRRILLVEDDRDLSLILRDLLLFEGFRVSSAVDGSEALERLTQAPYDLVITDMMMPVMDGFELLRHLLAEFPDIPVLALSAIPEYVRAARREGASDAVLKPFRSDELIRRVQGLLDRVPVAPLLDVQDEEAERERIAAVADLGPDAPDGLVRFTERTGRVFGMPVCAVTTVSATREHWYAACGMPEWLREKRGGPRDQLVCTHSVDGRTPLIVQNMAEHPFLKTLPIRKDAAFSFYAGAPVFNKEGHALGTLCLLDYQPRRFGHFDLELLKVLATRVGGELEW
ncbi:MAG: response regulator, partial [Myxococcaceae bacterium]